MKLLVVVDMQKDFVYGALGTPEAKAIVKSVEEKIQKYRDNGDYIIWTADTHDKDYLDTYEGKMLPIPHCIMGTEGSKFVIKKRSKEPVANKKTFGIHNWRNVLLRLLSAYIFDEIEIVGLCTDICVISNALILRATYPNTPIYVDAKCCAGTTPEKHEAALSIMESCQIIVRR